MLRLPLLFLMLFLCSALTYAGDTQSEKNQPPSTQEGTGEKSHEKEAITPQTATPSDDWSNTLHDSIANSVYQSALWFDSFFTENDAEQQTPKTSAKIRLGWLPKRRDLTETEVKFRLKVSLPNLKNKTDLIFSDDSDDNLGDLPLESSDIRTSTDQESFSAAIRYIQKREVNHFIDYRLGISSADVFIRARHKRRFFWWKKHGFKLEPSLYYFVQDGFGAKLLLEYDYQIDQSNQYRINYTVRASESFQGEKWKQGSYHLKQLSDNRAAALGLVVEGRYHSDQGSYIDKYTFSYRYRFNALRSWLFFEVEPFVEWAKKEDFTASPGIALRIEGYFQKN